MTKPNPTSAVNGSVVSGGTAPKIGATDFPSLSPLTAYERKYGHYAAQVCFIESIWALLEDMPSASISTDEHQK